MNGHTIWFTGLSSSGKTTIANEVASNLRFMDISVVVLDGDKVRDKISSDLGYTKEERDKHIIRVADICRLITDNDVLNIACVISPTRKIREYARNNISNFSEVYIKCSLKECQKRDAKGYYKMYKEGNIKDFVGMNVPYEEPLNPELVLDTEKHVLNHCVYKLLKYIVAIK